MPVMSKIAFKNRHTNIQDIFHAGEIVKGNLKVICGDSHRHIDKAYNVSQVNSLHKKNTAIYKKNLREAENQHLKIVARCVNCTVTNLSISVYPEVKQFISEKTLHVPKLDFFNQL